MYVCRWACTCECRYSQTPEAWEPTGAGITGCCESLAIDAGNQTWTLYRQHALLATEPFLQPVHIRERKEGKEKREGGREGGKIS